MEENVLFEKKGRVGILTLHRLEKRNALTLEMLLTLENQLKQLSVDTAIRALIIRGGGDQAFCSGFDIAALPVQDAPGDPARLRENNPLAQTLAQIEVYPYPVIAMVNGHAFGAGCELAVACDFRMGAEGIRMGMPPAKIGIVYPVSGLQRFVRTLGLRYTRRLFYTGKPFEGGQLIRSGLVDRLLPPSDLEASVLRFAGEIAENAPLALAGTKTILNMVVQQPTLRETDQARADALIAEALQSRDLKEGQRAFFEKRKPVFTGM